MVIRASRVSRAAFRLVALAAVAGALVACDVPSAPVSAEAPESGVETLNAPVNEAEGDSSTCKSGVGLPHGRTC
jgi:hypothetical protein